MPPAPIEANITDTTSTASCPAVRLIPNMFAARITKTGRWMHTPSMLTVAPSGSEKLESERETPIPSIARNDTGSVAALERVTNAVRSGWRMRASTR